MRSVYRAPMPMCAVRKINEYLQISTHLDGDHIIRILVSRGLRCAWVGGRCCVWGTCLYGFKSRILGTSYEDARRTRDKMARHARGAECELEDS